MISTLYNIEKKLIKFSLMLNHWENFIFSIAQPYLINVCVCVWLEMIRVRATNILLSSNRIKPSTLLYLCAWFLMFFFASPQFFFCHCFCILLLCVVFYSFRFIYLFIIIILKTFDLHVYLIIVWMLFFRQIFDFFHNKL